MTCSGHDNRERRADKHQSRGRIERGQLDRRGYAVLLKRPVGVTSHHCASRSAGACIVCARHESFTSGSAFQPTRLRSSGRIQHRNVLQHPQPESVTTWSVRLRPGQFACNDPIRSIRRRSTLVWISSSEGAKKPFSSRIFFDHIRQGRWKRASSSIACLMQSLASRLPSTHELQTLINGQR